jgi:hypothetical protein
VIGVLTIVMSIKIVVGVTIIVIVQLVLKLVLWRTARKLANVTWIECK